MRHFFSAFVLFLIIGVANAASPFETPSANQCFQDPANPNNARQKKGGVQNRGYFSLEEARFALRNALLKKSKECKTTNFVFSQKQSYNEVLGYIVKRDDGKYDISPIVTGGKSQVPASKPRNAVESMHTHPWFADWDAGFFAGLGPSGADIQTSKNEGIPAYVLDCASGDVYGVTQNGRATRLICNERQGVCKTSDAGASWDLLPYPRNYSQQEANARYNEYLQEQNVKRLSIGKTSTPSQQPMPRTVSPGSTNAKFASQTQTIDNTALKAQLSGMLEGTYQYASGIAAEGGVSAEYQSAVAPVMRQGRAAISAIPDQQTVTIPSASTQDERYPSEIMDQFGRTFTE